MLRTKSMNRVEKNRTRRAVNTRTGPFRPQVESLEFRRLLAISSEWADVISADGVTLEEVEPPPQVDGTADGIIEVKLFRPVMHPSLEGEVKSDNTSDSRSEPSAAITATNDDRDLNSAPWLQLFQSLQRTPSRPLESVPSQSSSIRKNDSLTTFSASIIHYFSSQPSTVTNELLAPENVKPKQRPVDDDTPEGLPPDSVAVESPSRPDDGDGAPSVSEPIRSPLPQSPGDSHRSATVLAAGSAFDWQIADRVELTNERQFLASQEDSEKYGGLIAIENSTRSESPLSTESNGQRYHVEEPFDADVDATDKVIEELVVTDDLQFSRPKPATKEKPEIEDDYHKRYQVHRRKQHASEAEQRSSESTGEQVLARSEFGGMISIEPNSEWLDGTPPHEESIESVGYTDSAIFSEIGNAQAFGFLDSIEEEVGGDEFLNGDEPAVSEHVSGSSEFTSAAVLFPLYWHGCRNRHKVRKTRKR